MTGSLWILAVHDGGGSGDARGVAGVGMAERPQTPDEAGGFRTQRAGEGVRFVEYQVIQPLGTNPPAVGAR